MSDLVVNVEIPEDETPAPEIVVIETPEPDNGPSEFEIGAVLGRLTTAVESLQNEVAELRSRATTAEIVAEAAEDTANEAVSLAIEAVEIAEETPEPEPEPVETEEIIEPDREHPLWKNNHVLPSLFKR